MNELDRDGLMLRAGGGASGEMEATAAGAMAGWLLLAVPASGFSMEPVCGLAIATKATTWPSRCWKHPRSFFLGFGSVGCATPEIGGKID